MRIVFIQAETHENTFQEAMVPRGMEVGNGPTIANRIAARRRSMPAAMSRIADVVLEHPSAPVELTITELAERAGTSPATVTRFCRAIGFDGYTQFRVGVASEVGRGGADETWRADIGSEFAPDDTPDKVLRTLVSLHVRSLETTAAWLDLEDVSRAAHAIATSRHVDIYGVGGSAVIATELQRRLHRIGLSAHAWSDTHDGIASAVLQNGDSVAIGVSSTGQTEQTVQMLAQAGAVGAFTVAITHAADSWMADVADVAIATPTPASYLRPDDMSVKHSQLLVVDLFYLLVAQQMFDEAATRLAATAMAVSGFRRDRASTVSPTKPAQEA